MKPEEAPDILTLDMPFPSSTDLAPSMSVLNCTQPKKQRQSTAYLNCSRKGFASAETPVKCPQYLALLSLLGYLRQDRDRHILAFGLLNPDGFHLSGTQRRHIHCYTCQTIQARIRIYFSFWRKPVKLHICDYYHRRICRGRAGAHSAQQICSSPPLWPTKHKKFHQGQNTLDAHAGTRPYTAHPLYKSTGFLLPG